MCALQFSEKIVAQADVHVFIKFTMHPHSLQCLPHHLSREAEESIGWP